MPCRNAHIRHSLLSQGETSTLEALAVASKAPRKHRHIVFNQRMSSPSSTGQTPPDTPVSDGSPATSVNSSPPTSINPNAPIFTQPPSPALPPKKSPVFIRGQDGVSWYTNTTIDDFSPLVAYSTRPHEWTIHRTPQSPTDSDRFLWTYHRTERENATATIEFWGESRGLVQSYPQPCSLNIQALRFTFTETGDLSTGRIL